MPKKDYHHRHLRTYVLYNLQPIPAEGGGSGPELLEKKKKPLEATALPAIPLGRKHSRHCKRFHRRQLPVAVSVQLRATEGASGSAPSFILMAPCDEPVTNTNVSGVFAFTMPGVKCSPKFAVHSYDSLAEVSHHFSLFAFNRSDKTIPKGDIKVTVTVLE